MKNVFKASEINFELKEPVFIPNRQIIPKVEEKLPPEEAAFTEEVFKEMPVEELTGSGQVFNRQNGEQVSPQELVDGMSEIEDPSTSGSQLSELAKKSRHMAALNKLKLKELELEALEEELRGWEKAIKEQEEELASKDAHFSEEMVKRRAEFEAEARSIVTVAKETAQSLSEAAKKEAEAIKKAALTEAEALKEKAYNDGVKLGEEKGFAKGEAEGLAEGELDWKNLVQEAEIIIKELHTARIGILKASEEEMLRLIIGFARAILKVEPLIQPEVIIHNLDRAINKVAEVDKIVLRINVKDKNMCQQHKDMLISKLSGVSELQLVEDDNLSPGGLKIETAIGTIDATIETQTKELEKVLMDKYRKSIE